MNRRALLRGLLVAPAAVKLAPFVKPAPMTDAEAAALLVAWYEEQLRAGFRAMIVSYEQVRVQTIQQFVDAAILAREAPHPFGQ